MAGKPFWTQGDALGQPRFAWDQRGAEGELVTGFELGWEKVAHVFVFQQ